MQTSFAGRCLFDSGEILSIFQGFFGKPEVVKCLKLLHTGDALLLQVDLIKEGSASANS
jgi:hypothetical protein